MSGVAKKIESESLFKDIDDILAQGECEAFNAPWFHRHLQQTCLSRQGYLFDYEDLKNPLYMERYTLNYLISSIGIAGKYISKVLKEYLQVPAVPGKKFADFVTPQFALPVSRFMAMVLRHKPAGVIFDVRTQHGCETFYTYMATQFVQEFDVPFTILPDYVYDYLAEPHPGFEGKHALTRGMVEIAHNHFAQLDVRSDNPLAQRKFIEAFTAAIEEGAFDPRLLPKSFGHPEIKIRAGGGRPQNWNDRRADHTQYESEITIIDPLLWRDGLNPAVKQMLIGFAKLQRDIAFLDVGGMAQELDVTPEIFRSKQSKSPLNFLYFSTDRLVSDFLFTGLNNLRNRYNIGSLHWNTNLPTQACKVGLPLLDEIWASSRFVYETFHNNNAGVPVYLMPPPVTVPQIPAYMNRQYFGLQDDIFYFIFTSNDLPDLLRENPTAIVEAFKQAFPKQKDVGLIFKIQHRKELAIGEVEEKERVARLMAANALGKQLRNSLSGDDRIHYIAHQYSPEETTALIGAADSYISLSRCQGFDYAMLKAMLLSKPVIATNWSGYVDFVTPETGCPVDCKLVDIDLAGYGYLNNEVGHIWADASVGGAAEWMQKLYHDRNFAKKIGENGREFVKENYSAEKYAVRCDERIREIRAGLGMR